MKKILMLLFPIVCALLIIGCRNSGANENAKKYYYDENVHYKVDKNGEYIDVEEHTFIKDYCYICDVHISIKDMLFKLINNEQEYAIFDYNCSYPMDVVIPSEYNGLPVTKICSYTFGNTNNEIIIPSNITEIEEYGVLYHNIILEHKEIPEGFAPNWFKNGGYYLNYGEGKYKVTIHNNEKSQLGFFVKYGEDMPKIYIDDRFGYCFDGLFDQETGGNQYYDENKNGIKKWDKHEDSILYSRWGDANYTIKFDSNGGNGEMESMVVSYSNIYNNDVLLSENKFIKEGFNFVGWSLYNDNEVNYYSSSTVYDIVYDIKPKHNDTITLYAVWTEEEHLINRDTKDELTIMIWNGDGEYYQDIGHSNLSPSDISNYYVSYFYAMAKEFNKSYPNIKINLFSVTSENDDWINDLEEYRHYNGKYPDVFFSKDIPTLMKKGIIADLSIYNETNSYKSLNPSLMSMTNYYGFQCALPFSAIPSGIYINKELADEYSIKVPNYDWTWLEYTNFVAHKKDNIYFGSLDASVSTFTDAHIYSQLQNFNGGNEYVNLVNDDIKFSSRFLADQYLHSFKYEANDIFDADILDYTSRYGNFEFNYFSKGGLLTLDQYTFALPYTNSKDSFYKINSNNWDYYPRPSMVDKNQNILIDNHVGAYLSLISIYNYSIDDGNKDLSSEEKAKMDIAYAFTSFCLTSTEAWNAAGEQTYGSNNTTAPLSFPLIREGEDFNKQMEVWYLKNGCDKFKDKELFPGFAKVVELWSQGKILGVSDAAYPIYYKNSYEEKISIFKEIEDINNKSIIGSSIGETYWHENYTELLEEYNEIINQRLDKEFGVIKEALITYYRYDK